MDRRDELLSVGRVERQANRYAVGMHVGCGLPAESLTDEAQNITTTAAKRTLLMTGSSEAPS